MDFDHSIKNFDFYPEEIVNLVNRIKLRKWLFDNNIKKKYHVHIN